MQERWEQVGCAYSNGGHLLLPANRNLNVLIRYHTEGGVS